MNDLPVILAYFAQSENQQHLALLVQEESASKEAWETATESPQNPVNVRYLTRDGQETTVGRIVEDIKKYRDRIIMIHFSGHAGHDELLLSDGAGNPDGIAGLLKAYAPNLKLIVLNGCSTRQQVETFFGEGVPVVVATQCAVKDTHATLFGITLHQSLAAGKSIQVAYQDAILAVRSRKELSGFVASAVTTAIEVRGGMLPDLASPAEKIWGLFTNPQTFGAGIVQDIRWLAIKYQTTGGKQKINPEKAYIFGRDKAPYSDTFNEYFDPARNPTRSRVQHYLLAGARTESPLGLIRKFFYESIMQSLDRQFYYYSFSDLFDGGRVVNLTRSDITKEHILRKLLLGVTGPMPAYTNIGLQTADDLCSGFFGQNYFKQREYVLIAFRIPPEALTDLTANAIMDAMAQLSNGAAQLPPGRLSFLFFWAIEQEQSFWDKFSGSPLKKLISRFNPLLMGPLPPRLWVINRDYKFLKIPQRYDLEDWLNYHYRPATSYDLPDGLQADIFGQKNVETLENKLLDLIEKANTQTV